MRIQNRRSIIYLGLPDISDSLDAAGLHSTCARSGIFFPILVIEQHHQTTLSFHAKMERLLLEM